MVGRLLSYWEGNLSGAMLNFGGVRVFLVDSCTYSNVLRPCQCKGSIEYVHLGCLRHWVSSPRWTNTLVVSNSKNFPALTLGLFNNWSKVKGRLNIADTPEGSYFYRSLAKSQGWLGDLINFVLLAQAVALWIVQGHVSSHQRVTAVSERLVWFLSCQAAYPANVSKGGFLKLIILHWNVECR